MKHASWSYNKNVNAIACDLSAYDDDNHRYVRDTYVTECGYNLLSAYDDDSHRYVLQEQADNRSDLEDQELKDLSAWMQETNDLHSLIPQSDEDGSPIRPQTEEEEEINPSQTEEQL